MFHCSPSITPKTDMNSSIVTCKLQSPRHVRTSSDKLSNQVRTRLKRVLRGWRARYVLASLMSVHEVSQTSPQSRLQTCRAGAASHYDRRVWAGISMQRASTCCVPSSPRKALSPYRIAQMVSSTARETSSVRTSSAWSAMRGSTPSMQSMRCNATCLCC